MLDDDARAVSELAHALDGRVRVRNVVEGEFLALQDARGGHPGAARGGLAVEGRPLMGVLPVPQILRLLEHQLQGRGQALIRLGVLCAQVAGDHGVVAGGAPALMRVELREERRIVRGVDDHQHRLMVLRCGAQHRRPAHVDVLDGLRVA